MTPEEFRQAGHQLIDWIADYRARLPELPVRETIVPGEITKAFPAELPSDTCSTADLLTILDTVVVPGVTQVQHPMHYGWFPSNASLSSVLGDIASSGLGSLGISWESSPALTEVEEVVCDWLRQAVGLSPDWSSTFHDTASTSCLVALIVAREQATGGSYAVGGLAAVDRPPVVYCTGQAHSSVRKAALLAGFGADNVRVVGHDPTTFAMDVDSLWAAVADDRSDGRLPAAIVATVGTTATTAIDPLPEIVEVAGEHGIWVHVDAAMAGSAMILPACRRLWDGVEGADSITWNPHKWMGTVLDTSIFHIRDVDLLIQVMSTNPTYLWSKADGEVTQFRDWGIPLGRRFRALKALFQLRLDGLDAIQARLQRDIDNAHWLAAEIAAAPGWEVVAPVPLQTVCVVHTPEALFGDQAANLDELNRHTRSWVEAINQSGDAYLTSSLLDDRWVARVSVGVESTERNHVKRLWDLMQAAVA
jgi:aromatic-L-amino-acid decarboxylase